jgi:hypothetical protein
MNCRFCEARGIRKKLPATLEKRIYHFTANHPDVVAGMGMRIAANPHQFGVQLGIFARRALANGGASKLLRMLEKEGAR